MEEKRENGNFISKSYRLKHNLGRLNNFDNKINFL